jgi:hypothetical protein
MRLKVHPDALAHCVSCGSTHLPPVPCGLTFAERMRSHRYATEWMPAKMDSRERDAQQPKGKGYYDEEAIKSVFGQTGKDNYEEMMDDTQGVGIADAEDIRKHPELVAAHYLDNPKDEIDAEG